jgi:hypothetical protein
MLLSKGTQSVMAMIRPPNIEKPPRVGILVRWEERWPGSSIKCFSRATKIIEGIVTKVTIRAVRKAKTK